MGSVEVTVQVIGVPAAPPEGWLGIKVSGMGAARADGGTR